MNTNDFFTVRLAEPLHALGIISDADFKTIDELRDKQLRASATAETFDARLDEAVSLAAETALQTSSVETAIVRNAAKLPSREVAVVAKATEHAALSAAAAIVRKHAPKVPAALTDAFDAIGTETRSLLSEIGKVRTAAEAISFGVVEQWKRLSELKAKHGALDALRAELGHTGMIATSHAGTTGSHWMFREPVDNGFRATAGDDGLSLFLEDIRRRPYCPIDAKEAHATRTAWDNQQAAAA